MDSRLKLVRKKLKLTNRELASALNLSSGSISLIETGKRNLTDRTIADLERLFNVNPEWLKTGEGEMFQATSREAEIAEVTARMFKANDIDYMYQLMRILNQVSDKDMATLYNLAKQWVDAVTAAEADNED